MLFQKRKIVPEAQEFNKTRPWWPTSPSQEVGHYGMQGNDLCFLSQKEGVLALQSKGNSAPPVFWERLRSEVPLGTTMTWSQNAHLRVGMYKCFGKIRNLQEIIFKNISQNKNLSNSSELTVAYGSKQCKLASKRSDVVMLDMKHHHNTEIPSLPCCESI